MNATPQALHHAARLLAAAFGAIVLAWPAGATDSPEGPIGKVSQPIVVGDPVTKAQQKQLGLVTVNGGCSGTLLNQYWVLTADHCVTTDGNVGGPDRPLGQMSITATWQSGTVTPVGTVRYGKSNNLDVALIFLGRKNFGKRATRLIYHNEVDTSMTLKKYGQGICAYATGSGDTAQPAKTDCGYRSALFSPSAADDTAIVLPANASGQVGNGGDSGGPDFVTFGDGAPVSIASVQSTCTRTGVVPGQPRSWMWTTGISSCESAALISIRDDIVRHMKETPAAIDIVSRLPGAGDHIASKPDFGGISNVPGATDVSANLNCRSGFVWRVARPQDLVCVTPAARTRTASENAQAANFVDLAGAYGPNTCIAGYVWRGAFEGDAVCVTPAARDAVREENRLAPTRRAGN